MLAAQLEAILSDTKVQAVKIGMLGRADQVRAVAAALRKYAPPNVVLDPVLASTGGVPLLDEEGRAALLTELMPLCDLVTPNVPELGQLTGMSVEAAGEREAAARRLLALGAKSVLVKGGHLRRTANDFLYPASGDARRFSGTQVDTTHTHGTGCLLSSSTAALLARGKRMEDAVARAKEVVAQALYAPVIIGKGSGYPDVAQGARRRKRDWKTHEQRLALLKGIYVVTDSLLRPERSLQEVVEDAADGGANVIQLREKSKPVREMLHLVEELMEPPFRSDALFIVNDRVDVVMASEADGVHLGPEDMYPSLARFLLGPSRLVGVSVATVKEAKAAAPYASYFGVGAIFGSKTKLDAGAPIGVERIREIKAAFPDIPIVAIGGVNAENIASVAQAGADAAAVVSAVVAAPDMEAATRELVARFEAGKATGIEMPAYS